MRIAAIGDVHGQYEQYTEIPEADLYVFTGDLTNVGVRRPQEAARGIRWLRSIVDRGPLLAITGNHDLGMGDDLLAESGGIPVNDREVRLNGLTFRGQTLTTCFNLPYLAEQWTDMTSDPAVDLAAWSVPYADVIVSHGPPLDVRDNAGYDMALKEYVHIGSPGLRAYIVRENPKLVLCGHVHESPGTERLGVTKVVNTAKQWTVVELEH